MVPGVVRFFISCSSSSLGDELIPLFPSVPSPRVGTRKFFKNNRGGGGGGGGGAFSYGLVYLTMAGITLYVLRALWNSPVLIYPPSIG